MSANFGAGYSLNDDENLNDINNEFTVHPRQLLNGSQMKHVHASLTPSRGSPVSLEEFPAGIDGISAIRTLNSDDDSIPTVTDLRPEEIRWMYREEGQKKWTLFIGYDSLRIESQYRQYRQGLKLKPESKTSDERSVPVYVGVPVAVRDGLFEVDLLQMKCVPVYWTDDSKYSYSYCVDCTGIFNT